MKLLYNVEDRPKFGKTIVFAFQQILAILAATIAVPSIVGHGLDMAAAICGAGVGTIVYLLFTRSKSPVFLGSSFAFISSLLVAVAYGYCGIILGSIFAGLVYIVIAIIVKFAGTGWISKLMPPVVIGPTVALIGLSLAGSAMGDFVKASGASTYGSYNLIAIFCGLVAFFVIIICSTQKKFKSMRLIPFVIGIVAGYVVASIFSGIGYGCDIDYLKIINWTPLVENFVKDGGFVGVTAFLNYPHLSIIGAIQELISGESTLEGATLLDWSGVASIALAFIPVALVVFAEHIADHKNLGSIIGRELVDSKEPGLARTLLGDGVGSIAGTIFGVCPNTTYGESVGCVAITRNASIITIWTTAILAIILSFISPLMALLRTIPSCVMGGVCLTLYGFIAVSGLKMLKDIDLGNNHNLFVVSAILIVGIGGLTIKIPLNAKGLIGDDGANYIQITTIATALILGIVTNLILNKLEKKESSIPDDFEEDEEKKGDIDIDKQQLMK